MPKLSPRRFHQTVAMSQVDSFEINLEHDIDEQYQYEPGETLRGYVKLVVRGTTKLKAIGIQIKGEATVSWEEDDGNQYHAEETYIDSQHNLIAVPLGEDTLTIEKGAHRYPMEYTLPANLPSSFIGKFGSITYVVKATLKEDKRFGLSTMITSEPFLVLRKLNLDADPALNQEVSKEMMKRLWGTLCFCSSGKITATLKTNKTGHLPGEDIFMDAEIANDSPRTIKAIQAAIVMHSTFNARNKVRNNSQIVNKKRDDMELAYGEGRRWKSVRLTIPPYIPESRLDGCDIIDIRYELLFKVEVSGNNEIRISIPLVVGTVNNDDTPRDLRPPPVEDTEEEGIYEVPTDSGVMNGDANPASGDDVDIDLNDADAEKFRYPMEPGTTRKNPLFMSASGQ